MTKFRPIRRLLVANRSEIAIRTFRAATELGIQTIAVYAEEDKLSLHRFKADEAYEIGRSAEARLGPVESYLSIDEILRVAREAGADAIHPGYGFLSESPEFAEACAATDVIFIGPEPETMRRLGNKVAARDLAQACGVPVVPASAALPGDLDAIRRIAAGIGYPLMLKASWGGGGRGMRVIESEDQLENAVISARREARAAFGKDEVYLEKLVRRARHVEVQILGDRHGTLLHLFERDCSIQRRHQKVVERAPAPYLEPALRTRICEAALAIGRATSYIGAGTVEFLLDADTSAFYFIEVNPRIQVEHTVTETVTGLDIVKAQIRIAEGGRLGRVDETGIPMQAGIQLNGHALQCRITTESPENGFVPDYGRISAYRGAMGFGIRVDGGTAYSGAVVTRYYDALLEKVTAWAPTAEEAIARMDRALREYRIRGVATNLEFLHNIVSHPRFRAADYTTRFIDETPALLDARKRRDRATRLLQWIAEVSVHGHPETKGRARPPASALAPVAPSLGPGKSGIGARAVFETHGAAAFARWVRQEQRVLVTDTTLRDAHQSLLATRLRSYDAVRGAAALEAGLPELLSIECWGGATFDVAMRFLGEDPWERLRDIRIAAPNLLTQMLLRGANGVGYTNYPDNVVEHFVARAAASGIDIFRIFDCFNWVENMRVAIDAVLASGRIAQGAICYTGDILDPDRAKYSLRYYVGLARALEAAGCHVLAIKDMAGLLRPAAAHKLVSALREQTDLPLQLHTHDTSGAAAATVIAAIDAGIDAVDLAMDSMSGTTSQPCLGAVVEALRHTSRDTQLDSEAIRRISFYWEAVRTQYAAFESDNRSGNSEVYLHEMPGGQFTNLREQARSMGLGGRWHEVARMYRAVNDMLGDIVKVTPSSKVVGDMALMMVAQDLTVADVLDPTREIAFPASVIEMMRGDLGQPPGGFPPAIQAKILKGEAPIDVRPGALLPPADLVSMRAEAQAKCGQPLTDEEFASYLLYPKVFTDFASLSRRYGPLGALPTPVFFYGMKPGDEISVEIERGKSLVIRLQAIGEPDDTGAIKVFFELNGQPRTARVASRDGAAVRGAVKAKDGDPLEIGAPMPGTIALVAVKVGDVVRMGDVLATLEAMKMETALRATADGQVTEIFVTSGASVEPRDLIMRIGACS